MFVGWFGHILLLSFLFKTSGGVQRFPKNFKFGAATAAVQVEGAWNDDGKGTNKWDEYYLLHPHANSDNSTPKVAANSYYLWKQDVDIAAELGLDVYRFSISWSRILPTGLADKMNYKGIQYYNGLIDSLVAAGVEPLVTIYHLDLPYTLVELGGWTNPSSVDWFFEYAKLVFSLYSDRVKYWITINEPWMICDVWLNSPNPKDKYICTKNILLAHAKVYRYYHEMYKSAKGQVSIANFLFWLKPVDSSTDHEKELIKFLNQYNVGRFFHPIYSKHGGWPALAEQLISNLSIANGSHVSWLPAFTDDEKELVRGSADFLSFNYYSTKTLKMTDKTDPQAFRSLTSIGGHFKPVHLPGAFAQKCISHSIYPYSLRNIISWLRSEYGDWDIMISENGYPYCNRTLHDPMRITVINKFLKQILTSIHKDKAKIIGYMYFALIDGFEFFSGFTARFGLYDVDFNDTKTPRTPRDSARYYTCLTKNRTLASCDFMVSDSSTSSSSIQVIIITLLSILYRCIG
ncbi:myrosinase 1-like isoform X3 [Leptidea sinapis]|uniref:myrosinase 1-like isoform X1 n=1 Tax=Leptidea sinapis TaxID=189913 RepID=UPI0021448555|nr:myrosinase 1-like isoform X1 [Leptidea sinapis]XP_050671612.1 myrosinase 1-like isoform X2 [Leptidea sinapis]XP_050671613.1 myrosinase 1-like isoform X3 [Leptidea sinapis]